MASSVYKTILESYDASCDDVTCMSRTYVFQQTVLSSSKSCMFLYHQHVWPQPPYCNLISPTTDMSGLTATGDQFLMQATPSPPSRVSDYEAKFYYGLPSRPVLVTCTGTTPISKSCELQVSSVAAQVCTVSILFLQSTSQVFTDLCSWLQLKTEFADAIWATPQPGGIQQAQEAQDR